MKPSCVVSLVLAALALVVAPGCKSDGASGSPGGKDTGAAKKQKRTWREGEERPGGPPGLTPGLVEIMKNTGSGNFTVGYAVFMNQAELWFLTNGEPYPVNLAVNSSLTLLKLGPIDMVDADHDGKVTEAELCASSFVLPLKPGVITRVTETIVETTTCQ